jgi:hypothetical protein
VGNERAILASLPGYTAGTAGVVVDPSLIVHDVGITVAGRRLGYAFGQDQHVGDPGRRVGPAQRAHYDSYGNGTAIYPLLPPIAPF